MSSLTFCREGLGESVKVSSEVLSTLEFDRIKRMVASKAASVLGRTVSNRMRPIDDRDQIICSLEETSEMVRIIRERGRFPLAGLSDVEERMRAAKEGAGWPCPRR